MADKMGIVPFWRGYDRKGIVRLSQAAEAMGYDSVWVPEAWGYEQFQLLTEIALATKEIQLATGIANVYSRSAALLAMSAATLDEISGGRAILGLGTSGKNVVENLHGVPFKKPLTRLRETVTVCRALWRGDRLDPAAITLFEARPFRLAMKPVRPDIPIIIAALKERSITQIGRIADGWVPTLWPYTELRVGRRWLDAGAAEAGRDPGAIEISPFVPVVPLPDRSAARAMVKPMLAFYIGGMGTFYHQMLSGFGFGETADEVRALYLDDKKKAATAAVSDDLVDAVAICGPPDYCRDKLAEWRAHGMDRALLTLPPDVPAPVVEQVLKSVAPR